MSNSFQPGGRYLDRFGAASVTGPIVVIDVLRAFTTAAYAFDRGAKRIVLVDSVEEALELKASHDDWWAMGENHGKRVPGFDLTNSPVEVAGTDLTGRTLVMRTTAGTRGVVACERASRVWAAGLVTASATARAVQEANLGDPHYVVTGSWPGRSLAGDDDWLTAQLIERVRLGEPRRGEETASQIRHSPEAEFTLGLGAGNAHPEDVEYALRVDHFDFALAAERGPEGHWELIVS
ncbi:2-phosphosulfolactate phosphatase [Scrofimicrobium sp. R131]|uniref:Probable 2-phosphosulfolactate phosphatase n=1 Tax=Scrofimicrobium appendicitidis TaxID=3079930 RepID=A0AAU7V876_9ACTO